MTDETGSELLKPVRRTVEFHPKTVARLEKIKEGIEAGSHTEVIRTALQLYEVCFDAKKSGATIVIKKPDGTETTLPWMLLPVGPPLGGERRE